MYIYYHFKQIVSFKVKECITSPGAPPTVSPSVSQSLPEMVSCLIVHALPNLSKALLSPVWLVPSTLLKTIQWVVEFLASRCTSCSSLMISRQLHFCTCCLVQLHDTGSSSHSWLAIGLAEDLPLNSQQSSKKQQVYKSSWLLLDQR